MSVTSDAGRSGRQGFSNVGFAEGSASARLAGGAAGERDILVDSQPDQDVTVVEAPRYLAFARPMGPSATRWGTELESMDDGETEAKMWIEVDLGGLIRAVPGAVLKGRIRRVRDRELAAIKAAVESGAPGGSDS